MATRQGITSRPNLKFTSHKLPDCCLRSWIATTQTKEKLVAGGAENTPKSIQTKVYEYSTFPWFRLLDRGSQVFRFILVGSKA